MRIFFLILSCFILSPSFAQSNKIEIGIIDSIHSNVLKEQRKIWVSVPHNFGNNNFSPVKYPVVYLLDGDAHFTSVVGPLQQMSSVNGNTICPEMIVVGIPNTDRARDLTPTHSDIGPDGTPAPFLKTSGGGGKFLDFIEKELIPHIDSLYPTQPYRMFIGHSLGGLMVVESLMHHPKLFNSYISIDPSMWWDNKNLLKASEVLLRKNDFKNKSLFIAVANTMHEGMKFSKVEKDTANASLHIRSVLELSNLLSKSKNTQLKSEWKYYPDDSHGSVPLIATYDAIRFFFKKYKLKEPSSPADTAAFSVDYLEKHYKDVSEIFGYNVLPPETLINGYGYVMMGANHMNLAKRLFQYNVNTYPKSQNVYDSMGDYYEASGDKPKAIEFFRKALAIKEVAETREKLVRLEKQ